MAAPKSKCSIGFNMLDGAIQLPSHQTWAEDVGHGRMPMLDRTILVAQETAWFRPNMRAEHTTESLSATDHPDCEFLLCGTNGTMAFALCARDAGSVECVRRLREMMASALAKSMVESAIHEAKSLNSVQELEAFLHKFKQMVKEDRDTFQRIFKPIATAANARKQELESQTEPSEETDAPKYAPRTLVPCSLKVKPYEHPMVAAVFEEEEEEEAPVQKYDLWVTSSAIEDKIGSQKKWTHARRHEYTVRENTIPFVLFDEADVVIISQKREISGLCADVYAIEGGRRVSTRARRTFYFDLLPAEDFSPAEGDIPSATLNEGTVCFSYGKGTLVMPIDDQTCSSVITIEKGDHVITHARAYPDAGRVIIGTSRGFCHSIDMRGSERAVRVESIPCDEAICHTEFSNSRLFLMGSRSVTGFVNPLLAPLYSVNYPLSRVSSVGSYGGLIFFIQEANGVVHVVEITNNTTGDAANANAALIDAPPVEDGTPNWAPPIFPASMRVMDDRVAVLSRDGRLRLLYIPVRVRCNVERNAKRKGLI